MKDLFRKSMLLLLVFVIVSCTSFKPGWSAFGEKKDIANIEQLLDHAHELEAQAATTDEVLQLIEVFKEVERVDPHNYYALWKIGNYNILMGAAYSEDVKDKKLYYREAIQYCEKAMCNNQAFFQEVENGVDISDACGLLSVKEIDAMGYWYTARFYYFKDCLKPMGRVFNTRIVIQNNTMIERIDELDPTWAGGGNYFSRALYYIAVPEKFGGSKQRAESEFSEAIKVGPDYLVNRWGRAKYLYQLVGNTEGNQSDLEWVVSQDPHTAGNPYPWNVYFQEDARKMLADSQ